MVRTRISLAVVVLLGSLSVVVRAQGPVASRLHAAGEAKKLSSVSGEPERVDVARRQSSRQEPGRLDVAESLGHIKPQNRPASPPSNRRHIRAPEADDRAPEADDQAPEADDKHALSLEGPLSLGPDADDASQAPQPLDAPGADTAPHGLRLLEPRTTDDAQPEESPSLDAPATTVPSSPLKRPANEDDKVAPAEPAKEFSPGMIRLRDKIRSTLSYYYQRPTSVNERSPWGVMHSLISFGVDTELIAGNRRVNAIAWLCANRPCKGLTLLSAKNGQLALHSGPGYQGHEGQLLSMLALCRVQITYPLRVDGRDFTVADLVKMEQRQCRPKSELSFQLIGLAHYLPSDATWKNDRGEEWDIPRMIREELAQPINGVACGGTHRLIGLSMAVKTRLKRGEPLDGEWLRAHKFVTAYQQHAYKLQNSDGSFSTKWLERREASPDVERRLQTTGHILEWLIFSLPEDELTDPRLVKSVNYLATLLANNRSEEWEIGPRGHALRALVLYNERVFGDKPGELRTLLARRPGK